jgi:uncharacterized glyoxalase superfamily protein PhnB
MNPPPQGWPRISSAICYDDPKAAIDWLCRAFGFEVRLKVEGDDGSIEHSELTYGEGLIMVGGPKAKIPTHQSPRASGGHNTQNLMVYVDDLEAHCKRARAAGAKVLVEPEVHDYGGEYWSDRSYEAEDIGGHHWWFTQRLRSKT